LPLAYSRAATNGTGVERRAVRLLPEAIPLQRDEFGAVHEEPESSVEPCVIKAVPQIPDQYVLGWAGTG
jgi:hypothetical protein